MSNIGRRTGVDVLAGKNVRRDSKGVEMFEDYFTLPLEESAASEQSIRNTRQSVGRRTGKPVLKPNQVVRKGAHDVEVFEDYFTRTESLLQSELSGDQTNRSNAREKDEETLKDGEEHTVEIARQSHIRVEPLLSRPEYNSNLSARKTRNSIGRRTGKPVLKPDQSIRKDANNVEIFDDYFSASEHSIRNVTNESEKVGDTNTASNSVNNTTDRDKSSTQKPGEGKIGDNSKISPLEDAEQRHGGETSELRETRSSRRKNVSSVESNAPTVDICGRSDDADVVGVNNHHAEKSTPNIEEGNASPDIETVANSEDATVKAVDGNNKEENPADEEETVSNIVCFLRSTKSWPGVSGAPSAKRTNAMDASVTRHRRRSYRLSGGPKSDNIAPPSTEDNISKRSAGEDKEADAEEHTTPPVEEVTLRIEAADTSWQSKNSSRNRSNRSTSRPCPARFKKARLDDDRTPRDEPMESTRIPVSPRLVDTPDNSEIPAGLEAVEKIIATEACECDEDEPAFGLRVVNSFSLSTHDAGQNVNADEGHELNADEGLGTDSACENDDVQKLSVMMASVQTQCSYWEIMAECNRVASPDSTTPQTETMDCKEIPVSPIKRFSGVTDPRGAAKRKSISFAASPDIHLIGGGSPQDGATLRAHQSTKTSSVESAAANDDDDNNDDAGNIAEKCSIGTTTPKKDGAVLITGAGLKFKWTSELLDELEEEVNSREKSGLAVDDRFYQNFMLVRTPASFRVVNKAQSLMSSAFKLGDTIEEKNEEKSDSHVVSEIPEMYMKFSEVMSNLCKYFGPSEDEDLLSDSDAEQAPKTKKKKKSKGKRKHRESKTSKLNEDSDNWIDDNEQREKNESPLKVTNRTKTKDFPNGTQQQSPKSGDNVFSRSPASSSSSKRAVNQAEISKSDKKQSAPDAEVGGSDSSAEEVVFMHRDADNIDVVEDSPLYNTSVEITTKSTKARSSVRDAEDIPTTRLQNLASQMDSMQKASTSSASTLSSTVLESILGVMEQGPVSMNGDQVDELRKAVYYQDDQGQVLAEQNGNVLIGVARVGNIRFGRYVLQADSKGMGDTVSSNVVVLYCSEGSAEIRYNRLKQIVNQNDTFVMQKGWVYRLRSALSGKPATIFYFAV